MVEYIIAASRGRNPDNPSDRTTGAPTKQRLEPNRERICNTLTTVEKDNYVLENGSGKMDVQNEIQYRIRKLTPRECWRLMDFSDRDFDRAKYNQQIFYLEGGGGRCNANLKVATEKHRLTDTETYVSCTTKDSHDMEILRIITEKSTRGQESERTAFVNFVIEKLEDAAQWECATNTIKCLDYMGIRFTLIREKEQRHMGIIAQAKQGGKNTEKFMKIIMESNLEESKLYTILTLCALIIESKIFTATIQSANISGHIKIIEDCENSFLMQLSNLRMETIGERMSNTALYKQAGNSIVRNVLVAIFGQMIPGKENVYKGAAADVRNENEQF